MEKSKESYLEEAKTRLRSWEAALAELKTQLENAQEQDVGQDYATLMEELQEQFDTAQQQMDEIEKSDEGSWQTLKEKADQAMQELEKRIKQIK